MILWFILELPIRTSQLTGCPKKIRILESFEKIIKFLEIFSKISKNSKTFQKFISEFYGLNRVFCFEYSNRSSTKRMKLIQTEINKILNQQLWCLTLLNASARN